MCAQPIERLVRHIYSRKCSPVHLPSKGYSDRFSVVRASQADLPSKGLVRQIYLPKGQSETFTVETAIQVHLPSKGLVEHIDHRNGYTLKNSFCISFLLCSSHLYVDQHTCMLFCVFSPSDASKPQRSKYYQHAVLRTQATLNELFG